jgi:predicted acyl esterase
MPKSPFARRRDHRAPAHADTVVMAPVAAPAAPEADQTLDLRRRRDQLSARLAELQWDLGGLAYEMAVRNHIRPEVIVQRAAVLQDVDAELSEVERILRMDETGAAGTCGVCRAPHSSGAVFCWQCGAGLLPRVAPTA